MIDVLKIRVSKAQLQAMPLNERALFILLGYAANQLNLFSKLVLFSTNKTPDNEVERTLSGAQTQMLLRMVVGVLHEAWAKIITNRFLKSPLAKDYLPRLDQGGRDALDASDVVSDGEWNWYFSKSNFNLFYFMSEFIILHGILKAIGESDLITAQERLMEEIRTALNEMTTLIMALIAAIWRKHFGPELEAEVCAKVADAPGVFEFWLPFFVEVPDGPVS